MDSTLMADLLDSCQRVPQHRPRRTEAAAGWAGLTVTALGQKTRANNLTCSLHHSADQRLSLSIGAA
jgi:hypothetical protein